MTSILSLMGSSPSLISCPKNSSFNLFVSPCTSTPEAPWGRAAVSRKVSPYKKTDPQLPGAFQHHPEYHGDVIITPRCLILKSYPPPAQLQPSYLRRPNRSSQAGNPALNKDLSAALDQPNPTSLFLATDHTSTKKSPQSPLEGFSSCSGCLSLC